MNQKIILKKILIDNNSPNIILYGPNHTNLTDILISCYKNIKPYYTPIIQNYKNITYQKYHNYYEFNMKLIRYPNIPDLVSLIKEISNHTTYYSSFITTIVFHHFEKTQRISQDALKKLFEKYKITTKFIILTSKIHRVTKPIISLCICIRIPSMINIDKLSLLQTYFKQYKLSLSNEYHKQNVKELIHQCYLPTHENDIKYYFIYYYQTGHIFKTPIQIIYQKLIHCCHMFTINKMKELAYMIQLSNIDFHNLLHAILINLFTSSEITHSQKYILIHKLSQWEYNYLKSYRKLIHIEYLLTLIHSLFQ